MDLISVAYFFMVTARLRKKFVVISFEREKDKKENIKENEWSCELEQELQTRNLFLDFGLELRYFSVEACKVCVYCDYEQRL